MYFEGGSILRKPPVQILPSAHWLTYPGSTYGIAAPRLPFDSLRWLRLAREAIRLAGLVPAEFQAACHEQEGKRSPERFPSSRMAEGVGIRSRAHSFSSRSR